MSTNYPNLDNLIGCYFHQDWQTEGPTVDAVLETYLKEYSAEYPPLVLAELRALLQRSDAEVEAELDKMGCEYSPEGDNTTYREWLDRMEARLSQQVKANGG
jgi:hypothetical protein